VADVKKTIEIVFGAVDNTGKGISSAAAGIRSFADGVSNVTRPLSDMGDFVMKAEASILALGAAVVGFAVNESVKFQSAMFDLQKVLSDTDPEISYFTELAEQLSQEFGVAADGVLGSMANFKQAGFTAQEAAQLTRSALDLMIAGDIDMQRGSDLLVASIRGFQAEAKDAIPIIDLLNAVSNEYATSLPELIQGFSELSPVAKAAGLSFEETAGILTPVIEVFRSGSEAGTSLKTSLLRLLDDSKPVQEALAALGVSQRTANGELRTARDVYFDVAAALGNMDQSQKLFYAGQLVGVEQAARFITATEGVSKTLRIASADFDYAGSAAQEVAVRMSAAEVQISRMQSAFAATLRSIGDPLLDEYSDIGKALADILNGVGDSIRSGSMNELVVFIEGALQKVAAALGDMSESLPAALDKVDFSKLLGALGGLEGAVGDLFGQFDPKKPEDVAKAIQFLVDSFTSLTNVVTGIAQAWRPTIEAIISTVQSFNNMDEASQKAVGGTLGLSQIFEKVLSPIIGGAANAIEGLSDSILVLSGAIAGKSLLGSLDALGDKLDLLGPKSSNLGKLLGHAGLAYAAYEAGHMAGTVLKDGIDSALSAMTGSETTLGSWIYDLTHGKDAADELAQALQGATSEIEAFGEELSKPATDAEELAKAAEAIASGIDGIAGAVSKSSSNGIATYFNEAGEAIATVVESQEELDKWNNTLLTTEGVVDRAMLAQAGLLETTDELLSSTSKMIPVYDAVTGEVIGYEQNMLALAEANKKGASGQDALSDAAKKTKQEIEAAEKATREWNLEMAKLASAEVVASIEANSQIAVARIQSDAQTMVAAYESVAESVTATSALIGELYGSDTAEWDRFGFEQRNLIDEANKRANALTDAQIEMLKEQARALRERTDRMMRGDSMITINGDGLQPHLEAFMWEILKAIQMRVNADGLEMLMGVPQ
jgi:TP901 family phage tail tape measure protein